jgi:chlorophyllide a reductase subunit Y
VALVGEIFPVDAITIGRMLEPLGLAAGPDRSNPGMARALRALASPIAAMLHPFYTATARQFTAAGRTLTGSAPVGLDGTERWLVRSPLRRA